jgi:hypothetical protein
MSTDEGTAVSVDAQKVRSELAAIGLMAETFGLTEFASAKTFTLKYDRLRDLLALAYLNGKRDGMSESERIVRSV